MISVIIPVHNEENIIGNQLAQLVKLLNKTGFSYEIVAVENGSTDNTLNRLLAIQKKWKEIKVLTLSAANYGQALLYGMKAAKGEWIFNFDIDYYDIDFIRQVMALKEFGYDLVVASKNCRMSEDNRSRFRRVVSSVFKYYLYYGFGLDVSDTHGIKGWKNDSFLKTMINQVKHTGEIFDTELVIRSHLAGRKHLELPIRVNEIRKSVTKIIPRAIKGFLQVSDLWLDLRLH